MAKNQLRVATSKTSSAKAQPLTSAEPKYGEVGHRQLGTLQVEVDIQDYEDYQSLKRLEVTVLQKLFRAKEFTEVGYMVAFYVDKRINSYRRQHHGSKSSCERMSATKMIKPLTSA